MSGEAGVPDSLRALEVVVEGGEVDGEGGILGKKHLALPRLPELLLGDGVVQRNGKS